MTATLGSLSHRLLTRLLGRTPTKGERDELRAGIADLVARRHETALAELRRRAADTGDVVRSAAFAEAISVVSAGLPTPDEAA